MNQEHAHSKQDPTPLTALALKGRGARQDARRSAGEAVGCGSAPRHLVFQIPHWCLAAPCGDGITAPSQG